MMGDLGRWEAILGEHERRRAFARSMGGTDRIAKQQAAGKLDARQRAAALFDEGSFVEIGAFTAVLSEGGDTPAPADGLVAGFGRIDGRPALAGIEDFTVLAGSIGDAGADKRYRLTQLAAQERLPLVFMLEGAGHRLTNAHQGRSPNDLQGLADLSGQVPMLSLVMGPSAGHGALTAMLSDFVVMTKAASMFAAGPPLVKSAIGEVVTKEELGGPQVHVTASGVAHNLAEDDAAAIAMARRYLSYFPSNAWGHAPRQDGPDTAPRRIDELLSIIDPDPRFPFSMRRALELVVDAGSLLEIQPAYGAPLVTALARIGGHSVAIVANDPAIGAGAVDAAAADKAAHFLDVAGAFHLPVIFLTDNPGVMAGTAAEKSGALRSAARMFVAQHRLRTPKIHVTLRKAFGFGSSIMAMNPFDGQTLSLAFPAITLGAMPAAGGADAAKLDPETRARIAAEQAGGAYHLADKLAFDDVIDPRDLRNALITGLAMAEARRAGPFGPVRLGGVSP
ncbi:Acetyl-CoA carboxylase, carboxyltransferase component [Sphingomonas laterariae]|uniref:Acetyl-CoA carboxylase, carboxyltransferase component n=1 Tax=Edaphosphingomonas laterariae TaxID=861865 RepID=A0A239BXZ9_9SPHN|nr:carboxyl transferase domain-containing protein [Sphingomonas laterariae]SNS12033.1 Acetyl-CoA carboxylase, carboxyltransferase component [Sphingomonas laterariae]